MSAHTSDKCLKCDDYEGYDQEPMKPACVNCAKQTSAHTKGKISVVHEMNIVVTKDGCGFNSSQRPHEVRCANAERITALWNAAEGMSNDEAVKALENYREMSKWLHLACGDCGYGVSLVECKVTSCPLKKLLNKLEG